MPPAMDLPKVRIAFVPIVEPLVPATAATFELCALVAGVALIDRGPAPAEVTAPITVDPSATVAAKPAAIPSAANSSTALKRGWFGVKTRASFDRTTGEFGCTLRVITGRCPRPTRTSES